MTQETPGKVFSLLTASMLSMFMLFAVSTTNASFTNTEFAFPDPFAPQNVVAAIDLAANAYEKFVQANLIDPAQQSFAVYIDNLNFIIEEAGPSILAYTGFDTLVDNYSNPEGQVAGAYDEVVLGDYYEQGRSLSIDTLYSILIQ